MGKYRDKVIELVDDGVIDPKQMVLMLARWLSEADCEQVLDANELTERFDEDEEEEV